MCNFKHPNFQNHINVGCCLGNKEIKSTTYHSPNQGNLISCHKFQNHVGNVWRGGRLRIRDIWKDGK